MIFLQVLISTRRLSLHQVQQVRKVPRDQKEKKAPLDHQPRKEVRLSENYSQRIWNVKVKFA
jgi:hypothetical protein